MNWMNFLIGVRKRIIGVVAVVLLVVLMMNLNGRLGEYFRLSSERDKLQSEVDRLGLTQEALETQVAYATSDQAVDEWARNQAHMIKDGDQLVIPVTPAGQTLQPRLTPTPTPQAVENWEVWWTLFFGK
jgi:cell division protein FtsB